MNLRERNKVSAQFNMSSMTDIIFLLLIFFIVALTTMSQTNALDLTLPTSDGKSNETETVAVSIDEKSAVFVNQEQVTIETLEATLTKMLANQPDKNIVLHVAKGVAIEHAVNVMDIAYRNNFKIVLAVEPK